MDPVPSAPARVFDAATKRYIVKTLTRWSPLVAATVTLALVVALTSPPLRAGSSRAQHQAGPSLIGGAAGSTQSGGPATSTGGNGTGGTSGAVTAGAGVGSPGTTRTGVNCGPSARQFAWSAYAPVCAPAFHGSNGGATSHGVTGTTITISYRKPNSVQQSAAQSLAGDAYPNDDALIADMQTYLRFFNAQFELYGRKVQLLPYQGQGDFLQEDQGQGLAATQADAQSASDEGAFADVTMPLFGSQFYEQDLAEAGVVAVGGLGFPTQWYQQYSPYEYSVTPTGTAGADGFVNIACNRMAGLPAIFAGDSLYQSQVRRFGFIGPDNPEYVAVGDLVQNGLQQTCGVPLAKRVTYSINVTSFEQQAVSVVAQMKQAGVTTVICGCDPLFPILLTQAADQQQYRPEWLGIGWYDPQGRLPAQDQMAHTLSQEGLYPPAASTEAAKVFQMAAPGSAPQEQYYAVAYYTMLYLFDALQAAGPNLNPQTFQQGVFSMPASTPGDVGTWQGGPQAFSPARTTQIGWWNPNATSNFDGKQGAWESCEGGRWFGFLDPNAWQPDHTQLACLGR
ncbi:MAG TPA: hypothetical protein VKU86_14310 [Acidimicrobiales bacterium]|nr:hypothetical protein [Acidimicrobiales bacterium]